MAAPCRDAATNRNIVLLLFAWTAGSDRQLSPFMAVWAKIRILDDNVPLYPSESSDDQPVCILTDRPEVEATRASNGFIQVKLANGQTGFTHGKVKVFTIKAISLMQHNVRLYSAPSLDSQVVKVLRKHSTLRARNIIVNKNGTKWIDVVTDGGHAGFIQGNAQVLAPLGGARVQPGTSRAQTNMLMGGCFFVIGVVVTAFTYATATRGGTYFIAWGAILFGGIRFFQGLTEFMQKRRRLNNK